MKAPPAEERALTAQGAGEAAVLGILLAISFSHCLNDTIQAVIPAVYPVLKNSFHLTFAQVGLITLAFQLTASILQPFVGMYTDRRPLPYSLAAGMGITLVGLVLLSYAGSFAMILVAAALVGMGSSVFHRRRRGSRAWHPAAVTVLPSPSSRSAATRAVPSARCSPR